MIWVGYRSVFVKNMRLKISIFQGIFAPKRAVLGQFSQIELTYGFKHISYCLKWLYRGLQGDLVGYRSVFLKNMGLCHKAVQATYLSTTFQRVTGLKTWKFPQLCLSMMIISRCQSSYPAPDWPSQMAEMTKFHAWARTPVGHKMEAGWLKNHFYSLRMCPAHPNSCPGILEWFRWLKLAF